MLPGFVLHDAAIAIVTQQDEVDEACPFPNGHASWVQTAEILQNIAGCVIGQV